MDDVSNLDPELIRKAAQRHGTTQADIEGIIRSMQRSTFEKATGILETLLKAKPRSQSAQ